MEVYHAAFLHLQVRYWNVLTDMNCSLISKVDTVKVHAEL